MISRKALKQIEDTELQNQKVELTVIIYKYKIQYNIIVHKK